MVKKLAFDYLKNFVNFINIENEGDSSRLGKILILVDDREMVELILSLSFKPLLSKLIDY